MKKYESILNPKFPTNKTKRDKFNNEFKILKLFNVVDHSKTESIMKKKKTPTKGYKM